MEKKPTKIEYMCSWCGRRETRSVISGRPMPGTCSKRPKIGNSRAMPHSWVINKKY